MIRESFNTNWTFYKEENQKEKKITGPISLPHDAMLLEKRDPKARNGFNTGYFPGGIYHYSKVFFAPNEYLNKHVLFEFEAVYMNSQVYLNGQLVGGRPYGYSNFYVAADEYLKYGQENKIEVVVHNENEPNSRWYSGSGIYRNVKILVGSQLHIVPDGVKITTKEIHERRAVLEVSTTVANHGKDAREVRLQTEFYRKNREVVTADEVHIAVNAGEITQMVRTIYIDNPVLWSVAQPNLYSCCTKILTGETVIDEDIETFGIRILGLDSKKGLRINDEAIKLRGGCMHHDNGVIGACTLEAAEDRRVRLMKESGFNAIRSAHNPMSKVMLDACDRHGMLVMDEFSDVWFRNKTNYDYSLYFREWWERDIQAMVDKDYNHPCVIMYSIGNEISETATPEGVEYSHKLAEKVRSLDPTRHVINSINGWLSYFTILGQKVNRKKQVGEITKPAVDENGKATSANINPVMNLMNKFMDLIVSLPGIDHCTKEAYAMVDIAGYNYMAGRYEKDGKRYPERVICGSETFPPEIAKNWRLVKKLPHVIGDFSWTGWDYLGEAGLCTWQYGKNQALFKPYPCILADSPMIDITGHRQTQSYMHEIVWGLRKEPYIAVQPVNHSGEKPSKSVWRGTNAIDSWTWDGCEGKRAVVEVYADADQVELFLNGKSLGKKPAGERHDFKAVFKTTYQPGELTAVSYTKDRKEIAQTSLKTASKQLQLNIHSETTKLKSDGADLAYVNIMLTDENGIVKPLADRRVTVQVEGAGKLMGFGSANPVTEESFTDDTHSTYQGRAIAVVRAGLMVGNIGITISTEGCETVVLVIPVEEPDFPTRSD
ncbi:MAG: glycoside hydrolase family 2 TIM barrel-domain containing protein [Anaerolineales bacterium]